MSDTISIAEILNQRNQMADLLCRIAYPGRGTPDEQMDIFAAAALVQGAFSILDLEPVSLTPDPDLKNLDAAPDLLAALEKLCPLTHRADCKGLRSRYAIAQEEHCTCGAADARIAIAKAKRSTE